MESLFFVGGLGFGGCFGLADGFRIEIFWMLRMAGAVK